MTAIAFTDDQIKKLEELGGNRWTKNDMDRMYFDATSLGLAVALYKSGNVRYADIAGEKISNSEAYRLMSCKFFIDIETGEAHTKCTTRVDDENFAILADSLEGILATVQAMVAEPEVTEDAEDDYYYEEVTFHFALVTEMIEKMYGSDIWESNALAWPLLAQVVAVAGDKATCETLQTGESVTFSAGNYYPWGEDLAAVCDGISGEVIEPEDLVADGVTVRDLIDESEPILCRYDDGHISVTSSVLLKRDGQDRVLRIIHNDMNAARMSDFQYIETNTDEL